MAKKEIKLLYVAFRFHLFECVSGMCGDRSRIRTVPATAVPQMSESVSIDSSELIPLFARVDLTIAYNVENSSSPQSSLLTRF